MRIPTDIDGRELARILTRYGYHATRQSGSHIRLTSEFKGGQHHITVPDHSPMKIGTLNSVIREVSSYLEIEKQDLIRELFEK